MSYLEKVEGDINKGFIKIWGGWLIICFTLGVIGTLCVYPFIGLADGFSRWRMAIEIVDNGKVVSESLLSPIIPYIQAVTYYITNSYGLYTILQATFFYFSIGMLVRMLIGEKKIVYKLVMIDEWKILSLMIIVLPTVYIFPLMLTDSSPVFSLLVVMSWLLNKGKKDWLNAIILMIVVFLCVGIRTNSFVLIGLMVIWLLAKAYLKKEKMLIFVASMLMFGAIIGIKIPGKLVPGEYNAATLGMTWELVGKVKNTDDYELKKELAKYGDVDKAIKLYGEPYLNSIVWDNNPPFSAWSISSEFSKEITKIYIKEVIRDTKGYLVNKWYFVSRSLGISEELITSARGIHGVDERTKNMGALQTSKQDSFRRNFIKCTDKISFISLRPINAIVVSVFIIGLMLIINLKVKKYIFMLCIGMGYYSSFLINTQAFEFRYYAPSFYIFLVLIVCGMLKVLMHGSIKVYEKLKIRLWQV